MNEMRGSRRKCGNCLFPISKVAQVARLFCNGALELTTCKLFVKRA